MSTARRTRILLGLTLSTLCVAAIVVMASTSPGGHRVHVTGYFANTNGIFPGDEVRILGVPVGKIDTIETQPARVKVTFWFDAKYAVPADAKAVIVSPSLVSSRAIQLTPAYTSGPTMADGALIPQQRTAVPVEFDDLRQQLQKLTATLQPTTLGGVSTAGALVNTTADNLRGQGSHIRETLIQLSQALSALGDHSNDIFSTIKNLSILVSALQNSADLLRDLNTNLADVSSLLANDPDKVGHAVADIDAVLGDVQSFVNDNRDTLGTTSDKLASVTTALNHSLDDVKQTLHLAPTVFQNFLNIYQPAQGTLAGATVINNFSDPISFLCGAIQAASRLNAQQSAKLCVQYLAPIVKNRQYNSLPIGENLFVGAAARPNEITYSEDWLRPDYVPPPQPGPDAAAPTADQPTTPQPPPAEAQSTNPNDGLPGIMIPPGAGS
jgi:phospholipid/cholesterol/gamma-HCH transport system substrate-binding protein